MIPIFLMADILFLGHSLGHKEVCPWRTRQGMPRRISARRWWWLVVSNRRRISYAWICRSRMTVL